jgi:hypothetical protein
MVAAAYRGAMTRTAHAGERTFVDAGPVDHATAS